MTEEERWTYPEELAGTPWNKTSDKERKTAKPVVDPGAAPVEKKPRKQISEEHFKERYALKKDKKGFFFCFFLLFFKCHRNSQTLSYPKLQCQHATHRAASLCP